MTPWATPGPEVQLPEVRGGNVCNLPAPPRHARRPVTAAPTDGRTGGQVSTPGGEALPAVSHRAVRGLPWTRPLPRACVWRIRHEPWGASWTGMWTSYSPVHTGASRRPQSMQPRGETWGNVAPAWQALGGAVLSRPHPALETTTQHGQAGLQDLHLTPFRPQAWCPSSSFHPPQGLPQTVQDAAPRPGPSLRDAATVNPGHPASGSSGERSVRSMTSWDGRFTSRPVPAVINQDSEPRTVHGQRHGRPLASSPWLGTLWLKCPCLARVRVP